MSLRLNCKAVSEVLLDDAWHIVIANSFSVDTYEFDRQTSTKPIGIAEASPTKAPNPVAVLCAVWEEGVTQGRKIYVIVPQASIRGIRYTVMVP